MLCILNSSTNSIFYLLWNIYSNGSDSHDHIDSQPKNTRHLCRGSVVVYGTMVCGIHYHSCWSMHYVVTTNIIINLSIQGINLLLRFVPQCSYHINFIYSVVQLWLLHLGVSIVVGLLLAKAFFYLTLARLKDKHNEIEGVVGRHNLRLLWLLIPFSCVDIPILLIWSIGDAVHPWNQYKGLCTSDGSLYYSAILLLWKSGAVLVALLMYLIGRRGFSMYHEKGFIFSTTLHVMILALISITIAFGFGEIDTVVYTETLPSPDLLYSPHRLLTTNTSSFYSSSNSIEDRTAASMFATCAARAIEIADYNHIATTKSSLNLPTIVDTTDSIDLPVPPDGTPPPMPTGWFWSATLTYNERLLIFAALFLWALVSSHLFILLHSLPSTRS
jgi:hypothetical protein